MIGVQTSLEISSATRSSRAAAKIRDPLLESENAKAILSRKIAELSTAIEDASRGRPSNSDHPLAGHLRRASALLGSARAALSRESDDSDCCPNAAQLCAYMEASIRTLNRSSG